MCGAIAAVGISAVATPAAENLEIRYGPLGVDMSVDDLEAFVAGEETSAQFRNLVRQIEIYAMSVRKLSRQCWAWRLIWRPWG